MSELKKKIRIVHKEGVTHVYDADGQDLTKQMYITEMSIEFDAAERTPKIFLTLSGPDLEIETDEADVEVKRKDWYSYNGE